MQFVLRFFMTVVALVWISEAKAQEKLPVKQLKNGEYPPLFFSLFGNDINKAIPSIGSFAVWRHNALIYERYFHGATDSTLFNVKSITKSVVSAIGGIAKDKGLLPGLQTPVLHILPEYVPPTAYPANLWFISTKKENDSIRGTLTLQDLLTMQTGFQWNDFDNLAAAYVSSSDPVKLMLELPFADYPGQTFNYCSGAASIFGAVLSKLIQSDLKEFANTYLFNPIGTNVRSWDTDPSDRYVGASEMYLTNPDLIRFGLLYLHKGQVGNKQIIAESWINESLAEHATLNKWPVLPNANGYGYFWWRRITNGYQAYVASGACGQLICIIPKLDMVIAATCFINSKNRGRSEIKLLHSFIDKVVAATKAQY